MNKELLKSIIKLLRKNMKIGESYERGDVYLEYKNIETVGSGSFDFDDNFWEKLEEQLKKDLGI